MTTAFIMELGTETVWTALKIVAPIMGVGFVVGLTISFIQAIMQVHEMTLAFVPKLIATSLSVVVFGDYILENLLNYASNILGGFAKIL